MAPNKSNQEPPFEKITLLLVYGDTGFLFFFSPYFSLEKQPHLRGCFLIYMSWGFWKFFLSQSWILFLVWILVSKRECFFGFKEVCFVCYNVIRRRGEGEVEFCVNS
ncbi:hypothetical protein PanWU01x14_229330, partial [Parasponia andersonii]